MCTPNVCIYPKQYLLYKNGMFYNVQCSEVVVSIVF